MFKFFKAYTDNEFDVAALMEEADLKAQAFERVNDLEDEVGRLNEKIQELEVTSVSVDLKCSPINQCFRLLG